MGKPLWNSEDHVYRRGFDCLISIVECFNQNYILSGATKVVNWYDIAGIYPLEPYSELPPTILAREPWSGLDAEGRVRLFVSRGKRDKKTLVGDAEQQASIRAGRDSGEGGTLVLDTARCQPAPWHRLTLRCQGTTITGLVDGRPVVKAQSALYPRGMAGLIAMRRGQRLSQPQYDNLLITPVGQPKAPKSVIPKAWRPLYDNKTLTLQP